MKNNYSTYRNLLKASNKTVEAKMAWLFCLTFIVFFGGQRALAQNYYQLQAGTFCPPPPGSGSLAGKNCFDIALGNDNANGCGALSGRTAQQANFTLPSTHTQTYTFTPSGTVSNVRFAYFNTNNRSVIIASSGGNSGNNISTAVTGTINFNTSLNTLAAGTTASTALTADVYAIYNINATNDNNPANDRTVKLRVEVKDCACCGANSHINNVAGGPLTWLSFQCHNLGANTALDPYTYVVGNADGTGGTLGYLYQWGRSSDGHQLRNSPTTDVLATSNTPGDNLFITIATGVEPLDWRDGGGNNARWGDGTINMNVVKAANDPCPAGYKVPSGAQWKSIFRGSSGGFDSPTLATANTWTWTGNGFKVGASLYLPAAGLREFFDGKLNYIGSSGFYWSTTPSSTYSISMSISQTNVNAINSDFRSFGMSVRCVAQ